MTVKDEFEMLKAEKRNSKKNEDQWKEKEQKEIVVEMKQV